MRCGCSCWPCCILGSSAPQTIQNPQSGRQHDWLKACRLWAQRCCAPNSAQAGWRIGGGRKLRRCWGRARGNPCRRGLWDADSGIPIQVSLATSGAVALASIFVAQAGQFITATHAVAIAGFRSGFDGNQSHGCLQQKITRGTRRSKAEGHSECHGEQRKVVVNESLQVSQMR